MRSAQSWLDEYSESHQHPTNKAIHWVCVPLIFFSTIGLLWAVPTPFLRGVLPGAAEPLLNLGTLGLLVTLAFYLAMSPRLFVGMALVAVAIAAGNHALAQAGQGVLVGVSAAVWLASWVVQLVGHRIEGRKPSFFKDVQFLLVGPAWLMHFVYRKLGLAW